MLCSKPHDLNECEEFGQKTLPERKDLIRKRGLCFGCLKPGHISSKCKDKLVCNTCEKKHPSTLHDPDWKPKSKKHQAISKENVEGNDQEWVNTGHTACAALPRLVMFLSIWVLYLSGYTTRVNLRRESRCMPYWITEVEEHLLRQK